MTRTILETGLEGTSVLSVLACRATNEFYHRAALFLPLGLAPRAMGYSE